MPDNISGPNRVICASYRVIESKSKENIFDLNLIVTLTFFQVYLRGLLLICHWNLVDLDWIGRLRPSLPSL